MLESILTPAVLEALGVLVSTFLLIGITRAGHFLSQKFATDRQRAILERVELAATNAVLATHQTFVEGIKGKGSELVPSKPLTPEQAAEALRYALNHAKTELGKSGLAELKRVTDNVEALLAAQIEAALLTEKSLGGRLSK